MHKCRKCRKQAKTLIQVKVYLGHDDEWGEQFVEEFWCFLCVSGAAMARSSYIYVLYKMDDDIVGTFTVKYEMMNYIKRHPGVRFDARRYRDGQPDASWSVVDL